MKTYSELIEAMTVAQRLKRSRVMKQKSKLIARKREISMKKPPSPEKITKAVKRAVRNKAISIVDKAGVYKDASPGLKQSIDENDVEAENQFDNKLLSDSVEEKEELDVDDSFEFDLELAEDEFENNSKDLNVN